MSALLFVRNICCPRRRHLYALRLLQPRLIPTLVASRALIASPSHPDQKRHAARAWNVTPVNLEQDRAKHGRFGKDDGPAQHL
jgi:hypothetical protein